VSERDEDVALFRRTSCSTRARLTTSAATAGHVPHVGIGRMRLERRRGRASALGTDVARLAHSKGSPPATAISTPMMATSTSSTTSQSNQDGPRRRTPL
jgi:hypothetical protein